MSKISISELQFDELEDLLVFKSIRVRHLLVSPGEISKYSFFVMKGCLRSYVIVNGKEDIIQFAPENWFIGNSVVKPEPSTCFIDAVEDSKIVMIDYDFVKKLEMLVPESREMRQKLRQNDIKGLEKRIVQLMSATAIERYNYFLNEYPGLVDRLPQHMIASYLGIRPQSLSRIRAEDRRLETGDN